MNGCMLLSVSVYGRTLNILNVDIFLTLQVSIGAPGQTTYVGVDTGSDQLWVNPNCSTAPTAFGQQQLCEQTPRYDPSISTTHHGPLGSSRIVYGSDGESLTGVELDYYKDTVAINGVLLKPLQQTSVSLSDLLYRSKI
jgi:hypothetical protein